MFARRRPVRVSLWIDKNWFYNATDLILIGRDDCSGLVARAR